MSSVGFVDVYEGVPACTLMEGYSVFKVRETLRKEPKPASVERVFESRLDELKAQDQQVDMEQLLNDVYDDLVRVADITSKDYLVVFDHVGERFLVDGNRAKGEVCLEQMKTIIKEDADGNTPNFEVHMPEPFIMEKLLTNYVLDADSVPEPMFVAERVKIGVKTLAGKKAKSPNITIVKEDVTAQEFSKHLTDKRTVHCLEVEYDGVVYANVDNTCMISGIKYDGELKYKTDESIDEQDNWLAEYQQILPELSKLVTLLQDAIENK